jgi:hypothetical protein
VAADRPADPAPRSRRFPRLDRRPPVHATADPARATNGPGEASSEDDYWRLAHQLLHDPDIATIDRVTGSFVLLYGQQLSRIATMTLDQVRRRRNRARPRRIGC